MIRAAVLSQALTLVASHGMMLTPAPRNARDGALPEFADGKWGNETSGGEHPGCNCANHEGGCAPATQRPTANGQPCLWFSQGCTIGCKTCTGTNGHTTVSLCAKPTTAQTLPRWAYSMNSSLKQSPLGEKVRLVLVLPPGAAAAACSSC